MRLNWLWIPLLVAALIAGCGGGDDDEPSGGGSDPTAAATTASSGSGSGGGDTGEIAPFSMPLPPGAVRENFRSEIGIQLFYPAEDYDAIVAFFDAWTDAESDEYERFERADPAATNWVWLDGASTQNRSIDVIKDQDGGNNFGTVTFVQIADEKAP